MAQNIAAQARVLKEREQPEQEQETSAAPLSAQGLSELPSGFREAVQRADEFGIVSRSRALRAASRASPS
jgi:hypothetical protein